MGRRSRSIRERREPSRNPKDHQLAIVEVEGDAPNCFEVRCSCDFFTHTHAGIVVAEELARVHFFQATGIAIRPQTVPTFNPKGIRQ